MSLNVKNGGWEGGILDRLKILLHLLQPTIKWTIIKTFKEQFNESVKPQK